MPATLADTFGTQSCLSQITPSTGSLGDGLYGISISSGPSKISDVAGNEMSAATLKVEVDTAVLGPQTVTFAAGSNGYLGTRDTFLEGARPNTDHSTAAELNVDGASGGQPVQGLLRFEGIVGGGAGQVPVGSQIAAATLELQVTGRGSSMLLHRMLRTWSDTDTWNSLGNGVQADDVEAASNPDVSTGPIGKGKILTGKLRHDALLDPDHRADNWSAPAGQTDTDWPNTKLQPVFVKSRSQGRK